MSKRLTLSLIGLWIIVYLFLGFPSTMDKIFSIATGLIILTIAFSMNPKEKKHHGDHMPYAEHKNDVGGTNPVAASETIISNASSLNS